MNTKICPTCNAPIPAHAPGGFCPACLLRGADEPGPAGRAAPSLAEIAAAFPQLEAIALIGQGGMGFVYKVRQPALDRTVALKILSPELSRDPAFAERFAREARVLGKLNHPNIVTVFEHGESGGFFYLLMEYVDGVNLRQAMRAGRFTPQQALAVVPGICDALQAAHAQGVWHRDIKPENILLDARGGVKIADFGIARIVGDPDRDFTLTSTGAALGSAAYMAPEQHEKPHDVDHRADIYSLGVVIYEMLTGELPLGRFPAPSQRAAVSARIDEIVFRTLEKERELRQQSAAEVKTDVTGAEKNVGEVPRSSIFAPLTPRLVAQTAILAGISLFTAAVFFTGGSDQGMLISLATVPFVLGLFGMIIFKSNGKQPAAERRLARRLGFALILLTGALAAVLYLKQLQREQTMLQAAIRQAREMEEFRAQQKVRELTELERKQKPAAAARDVPFLEWAQGEWIMDREESERATAALYPGKQDNSPGTAALRERFKPSAASFHARFLNGLFEFWEVSDPSAPLLPGIASSAGRTPLPKPEKDASPDQITFTAKKEFFSSTSSTPYKVEKVPLVFSKGENGLLQWTMEQPAGVKWVMVFRRFDAMKNSAEEARRSAAPATRPAKPVFGPVVERSLYFSDNLRTYIDFQSGELSRAQWALTAPPTDEAQKAWLKQSGVDAYAIEPITNKDAQTGSVVREHPRLSSWSGGCVFALVPHSQSFDDPRAEDMEARLKETAESQALMGGTYWFKTSDGAKGILHLFGINDSPPQVQLRYRLLAADQVAKDVESWSYTLRHLDAARLDAQMKAKPEAGVVTKVEAGVVTLTGPREAVRPLATMLRVIDQPEVKNPLELPLLNMPPDFFTRMAIPALMSGTEFKDTQFESAFFETLKRENITAPQLARALSAHVLELEKATFVNTGTPFESIMKIPGASTYYDGTIPCADQPDKPLTFRIRRTTQTMGTKPDIAGLAPWLIEEAKKQSSEPMPERRGKSAAAPQQPTADAPTLGGVPVTRDRRRDGLPAPSARSLPGAPVPVPQNSQEPTLDPSVPRGGATPLETILRLNELANANDKEGFKRYLAMNVPPAEVDGYVAERLDVFTGKIVGVWRTGAERRLGTQLDLSAPHPMYWFEREREGKRVFIQCFISVDKGRCLNFSQMSAPYRATARIEFRPTEGDPLRILRGVLPENSAFEVEQFFADAAPVAGQFNVRSYEVPTAEVAAAKTNELTQMIGEKLKALGQDSTYRVIKAATVPERPNFFTMPNLEQLFPEPTKDVQ